MLSFVLALLLMFTITKAGAYEDDDRTEVSGRGPGPKVNIVDPGSNIIAKLDCPGCPFVIGRGGNEELVSRPNSLSHFITSVYSSNGRLDLLGTDPNVTTFIPREWNECGRKDDTRRQRLCELAGWWDGDWTLFGIIFGCVVGAIPVLAGLFYLVWLLRQGQKMSTEYLEDMQRNEEEYERLIDTSDVQNETQGYTQDKSQSLPGADMVVLISGKSVSGEAGLKESTTLEPEPRTFLETDGTHEPQTPNNDDLISHGIEERSHGDDNQNNEFGPFVHNLGNPE